MVKTREKTLNPKALRVLAFVIRYKYEHDGNSPTYREIAAGAGLCDSTSYVRHLLERLVEYGYLHPFLDDTNNIRRLEVIGGSWRCIIPDIPGLTNLLDDTSR